MEKFGGAQANCSISLDDDNVSALMTLGLLLPANQSEYWRERSTTWSVFFYLMIIVYGILFLCFGISCVVLLAKRHLAQRFRVRTFIAIDLALIVLGFSRFVFLVVDPWGQIGFCTYRVCVVVSRLVGSLAFPSLTASYTLVFLTLWISARIQLGRSWVQRLKVLIPLCCTHYVAALTIETILLIPGIDPVVALGLLVACEAVFSCWGFLVCTLFFIAGFRLLKTLEKTNKSSSVICKDSPNLTRHDLIEKSKLHQNQHQTPQQLRNRSLTTLKLKRQVRSQQKAALRKITLITYVTVILGMLYSLLSMANLFLAAFSLLTGCPGELGKGLKMLPEVWLLERYIFFTLELCMAVLLTYAITDYTPLIRALSKALLSCCYGQENGSSLFRFSPEVGDTTISSQNSTLERSTNFELTSRDLLPDDASDKKSSAQDSFSPSPPPTLEKTASNNSVPKAPSPLMVSFSLEK